ncbi:hypothetical protein QTP88_025859 [Uroleucon formosanum]
MMIILITTTRTIRDGDRDKEEVEDDDDDNDDQDGRRRRGSKDEEGVVRGHPFVRGGVRASNAFAVHLLCQNRTRAVKQRGKKNLAKVFSPFRAAAVKSPAAATFLQN